jgi:catechol 2,3-dioxygenase-like lactoylglutathione lyase family enzyme
MENLIAKLVQDFETGGISRRQLIQSLAVVVASASGKASAAAAAPGTGFKTLEVSHISIQVKDYRVTRDFYVDLMGMKVAVDAEGSGRPNECNLTWGRGNDQYLIPRNHRAAPGQTADPNPKPVVDHFAFTIADWDKNVVEAELKRRGLNPRADTDDSFIIKDPDGFNLQIQGPKLNAVNPVYTPKK